MISEKDRPILGYLINIDLALHDESRGEGFDLIFTFSPNGYFKGTEIKKEMIMKSRGCWKPALISVFSVTWPKR